MTVGGESVGRRFARRVVAAAAAAGFLGVALGAFGAHGLENFLADRGLEPSLIARRLDQFEVAVRYHLVHAVALLALAGLPVGSAGGRRLVFGCFFSGLVLFCGSLYLLVLTDTPWLGAVTPFGGGIWLIGWLALGVTAWRSAGD